MGQRGPKPTPPALKLVQGNPGHRPIDLDAGVNPPVAIPDCPPHLGDDAKREWKRITVELEPLGLVSRIDMAMLALYCHAYGRWVFAERKIRELNDFAAKARRPKGAVVSGSVSDPGLVQLSPNEFEQQSVWLQISNKAMEQLHKYAAEFGMSPSMRARVSASRELQPQLPGIDPAPRAPTLASFAG